MLRHGSEVLATAESATLRLCIAGRGTGVPIAHEEERRVSSRRGRVQYAAPIGVFLRDISPPNRHIDSGEGQSVRWNLNLGPAVR